VRERIRLLLVHVWWRTVVVKMLTLVKTWVETWMLTMYVTHFSRLLLILRDPICVCMCVGGIVRLLRVDDIGASIILSQRIPSLQTETVRRIVFKL
jgi:hypothetical protein